MKTKKRYRLLCLAGLAAMVTILNGWGPAGANAATGNCAEAGSACTVVSADGQTRSGTCISSPGGTLLSCLPNQGCTTDAECQTSFDMAAHCNLGACEPGLADPIPTDTPEMSNAMALLFILAAIILAYGIRRSRLRWRG